MKWLPVPKRARDASGARGWRPWGGARGSEHSAPRIADPAGDDGPPAGRRPSAGVLWPPCRYGRGHRPLDGGPERAEAVGQVRGVTLVRTAAMPSRCRRRPPAGDDGATVGITLRRGPIPNARRHDRGRAVDERAGGDVLDLLSAAASTRTPRVHALTGAPPVSMSPKIAMDPPVVSSMNAPTNPNAVNKRASSGNLKPGIPGFHSGSRRVIAIGILTSADSGLSRTSFLGIT